jgi:hypothetical protein
MSATLRNAFRPFFIPILLAVGTSLAASWPVRAAEVGVKSLSGPPEEFAAHRLPSAGQTAVLTNILLVDRGMKVDNGVSAASSYYSGSSFDTSPGVGFSLVQVSDGSYFAPATITAPDGRQFYFDGWTITCNYGPCGEYQANLLIEAFTQTPGGAAVFSISGGEVSGGTWTAILQDPYPSTVESLISFEDNGAEVEMQTEQGNAAFELVDGASPVLHVSFATNAMRRKGLRSGIDVTALTVTVTDAQTRETFHQKRLNTSRPEPLAVDSTGSGLVRLPSLPVGEYTVRLDIEGKAQGTGRMIQRTAFIFLPIIARSYEVTGEVRAKAIDRERLELLVGIKSLTEQKKHVYAYAEVWSRDGQKPIAWIGGMTQPVQRPSGRLGLPIVLDTRWLALAGESGRELLLRNIRIQDPDTFIPIDQIAELPVTVGKLKLPRAASLSATEVVKDDSLYMGKGDRTISVPDDEPQLATARPEDDPRLATANHHNMSSGILLVHGWCSSPVWPLGDFGRPGRVGGTAVFNDPGASRSHDAFALRIRDQGASHFNHEFSVVAHSQGGAAALHLRAFYTSLLDNSTAPRRIQSMGTPYGGLTLMNYYLTISMIGRLLGVNVDLGLCPPQSNLGTFGSALWSSTIPNWARNEVFYYRTGYERPHNFWQRLQFWRWRCGAGSFVIPGWDDGVGADYEGYLSGAQNMGVTENECHTQGMKDGPQTDNSGRNDIMDREGRPALPTATFTWTPASSGYVNFDASGSYDPDGSIVSYTWDFGDGSPMVTTTSPWVGYSYAYGDYYSVYLSVTDNSGAQGSVGQSVYACFLAVCD